MQLRRAEVQGTAGVDQQASVSVFTSVSASLAALVRSACSETRARSAAARSLSCVWVCVAEASAFSSAWKEGGGADKRGRGRGVPLQLRRDLRRRGQSLLIGLIRWADG